VDPITPFLNISEYQQDSLTMLKSLYLSKDHCDNQAVKIALYANAWLDILKVQGDVLKSKINLACPRDK